MSQYSQRVSPTAGLSCSVKSSKRRERYDSWGVPTNNNNDVIPKNKTSTQLSFPKNLVLDPLIKVKQSTASVHEDISKVLSRNESDARNNNN